MDSKFYAWHRKPIADWGSYMSDEAKRFYKEFKAYLKSSFPDAELIGFKPNHYDMSGFIHIGERYLYVRHSINRGLGYVDFYMTGAMNGVLYRSAKNEKDYTGGHNNFTSLVNMVDDFKDFFQSPDHRWAA